MSRRFSILLASTIGIAALLFSITAAASFTAPTGTLRMGDEKPDVLLLQQMLNANALTKVADFGVGSPGNETSYFGNKTFDAVKRFQNLYASDILTPNNLTSPTGFFGPSTLKKLQQLATQSISTTQPTQTNQTAPVTTTPVAPVVTQPTAPQALVLPANIPKPIPLTPNMQIPAGTNPNSINLEYAIATMQAEGKKEGMSQADIDAMTNAMRTNAQSTTDFRAQFFNSVKTATGTPPTLPTSMVPDAFKSPLTRLLSFFHLVDVADAGTGVPFGGFIFFTTPCTCSIGTAMLIIEPLPPTYPSILAYVYGSQVFLSYNLPYSTALLGSYVPGVQACYMWAGAVCAPLPNQGLISPQVGSAPD